MSEREVFVKPAEMGSGRRAMLYRRFGISRKTGYKWLARYGAGGESALSDRSRRPHVSPAGASGVLIGEALLKAGDMRAKISELLGR